MNSLKNMRSPSKRLLIFCALCLCNPVTAFSEELISNRLDSISEKISELVESNDEEIIELQDQIHQFEVLGKEKDETLLKKYRIIEEQKKSLALEKEIIIKARLDIQDLTDNRERYEFQNTSNKYIPLIYSLLAISYRPDDADDKVLLYGLAGYGLGSAIENSEHGLGAFITFLKFDYKW